MQTAPMKPTRKSKPGVAPARLPPQVRRLWPGSTIVCIGSGPSLTASDVDFCCGKARVIAVNNAVFLAPWADALYACDSKWWHWHKGVLTFHGQKYALDARVRTRWPDITVLRNGGVSGLEVDPSALKTGHNSGYQAINLAVHLGAIKIVLLGYDMKPDGKRYHFFGEHPDRVPPPFRHMIDKFETLVEPLAGLGIEIVNATRHTALNCFPRLPLEQALANEQLNEAIA